MTHAPRNRRVYVLVIQHAYGEDFYVSLKRSGVDRRLDEYVQEWWDQEMPGKPMPRRRGDRIDEYLEEMSERRQREFVTMAMAELLR